MLSASLVTFRGIKRDVDGERLSIGPPPSPIQHKTEESIDETTDAWAAYYRHHCSVFVDDRRMESNNEKKESNRVEEEKITAFGSIDAATKLMRESINILSRQNPVLVQENANLDFSLTSGGWRNLKSELAETETIQTCDKRVDAMQSRHVHEIWKCIETLEKIIEEQDQLDG